MRTQFLTAKQNLFLLFLGIFLVIFTWVFLWPKVNQVFESKKAVDQEKVHLEKIKAKLADLKGLNEFELTERTELSLRVIPSEKKFLEVLSNLSQVANSKGLSMEGFQVTPGELAVKGENKLDFQVSFVGNSADVGDFLEESGKVLPIVDIKQVKIDTQDEVTKTGLSLATLFLPLLTSLGSFDSPVPKLTPEEEKVLSMLAGFSSLTVKELVGEFGPTGRKDPFKF